MLARTVLGLGCLVELAENALAFGMADDVHSSLKDLPPRAMGDCKDLIALAALALATKAIVEQAMGLYQSCKSNKRSLPSAVRAAIHSSDEKESHIVVVKPISTTAVLSELSKSNPRATKDNTNNRRKQQWRQAGKTKYRKQEEVRAGILSGVSTFNKSLDCLRKSDSPSSPTRGLKKG